MSNYQIHKLKDEILYDQNLGHFDSRLLLVLLSHRNSKNHACFPAQKRLASILNVSAEHVSKRLHVCRDQGYVDWKKSNRGLDYWFPWLDDFGPFERNADAPTLRKFKNKYPPEMNNSSSSELHKSSSANSTAVEPQFNSHLAFSSSSDMNHNSSSYITPELTPEINTTHDCIFESNNNSFLEIE